MHDSASLPAADAGVDASADGCEDPKAGLEPEEKPVVG